MAFFFRLRALISWILIWATNYPRPPGTQPTIIQIPKQISKSLLKIFHLTEEISKSNYRECTMLESQRLASFWILCNGHFVWNERRPDWTFFHVSPFSCLSLLMSARWIFFWKSYQTTGLANWWKHFRSCHCDKVIVKPFMFFFLFCLFAHKLTSNPWASGPSKLIYICLLEYDHCINLVLGS